MLVNGDYRSSNYTMSSDEDAFNFPPIKKTQQQLKEASVVAYSNQITKPSKKKLNQINPKLTMNLTGLSGNPMMNQGAMIVPSQNSMMISGNASQLNASNNLPDTHKMKHNSSNQSI